MRILIFLCVLSLVFTSTSQNSREPSSTGKINKKRFIISNSSIGLLSSASLIGLHRLWYSKESQEAFHLFDDSKNWMQMDKMGHVMSSYELSRNMTDVYEWSGMSRRNSALLASSISFAYMSGIEIMDGHSSEWGFSISDMAANLAGTGWFLFQESFFSKQIFQPKFSFHQTIYAEMRPQVLGSNFMESMLKDYNGQTYWISFSPGQLGVKKWPKWIMISLGHSINGRLKGNSSHFMGYESQREYLFSLDLDLNEIQIKSRVLKSLFKVINCVKIPFPAIIITKGVFNISPFYF